MGVRLSVVNICPCKRCSHVLSDVEGVTRESVIQNLMLQIHWLRHWEGSGDICNIIPALEFVPSKGH
jgi:hypothetical protein